MTNNFTVAQIDGSISGDTVAFCSGTGSITVTNPDNNNSSGFKLMSEIDWTQVKTIRYKSSYASSSPYAYYGYRVTEGGSSSTSGLTRTVTGADPEYTTTFDCTFPSSSIANFYTRSGRYLPVTFYDLEVLDANGNSLLMATPAYTLTVNPTPADADVRFEIEGTTVTEDVYNINTTSSTIVNNNGVLSGFTTSQYAYLPEYFAPNLADTWEMQLKFTYTYVNSYQRLCGAVNNTSVAQIVLGMGNDSGFRLQCWASSNGTQWNISSGTIGSTVFQNGTTYWLKVRFTGTQYQFDLSADGENFTREATITSSTHLNNNNSNFLLGNAELSGYFRGTIDLNECYIKIDDELWWEGKTVTYPNPVTVEENTAVTYTVSKTGYTTQTDTVTVNANTVLNVVLSKPSSIRLGSTSINKIMFGSTEINRMYLGSTLVYGEAPVEDWTITDSGGSLSRTTFPYTVNNFNSATHPEYGNITATTQFDVSNIGLNNNMTVTVDGSTLSGTSGLYARDCTAIISCTGSTPTSLYTPAITSPISGDFDYMHLDKAGKCIEVLDHYLPYEPTYPENFITFDSANNTLTLAAGEYDASTRYNTPVILSASTVLNNMGGLFWADSNFEYMIDIARNSYDIYICSNSPGNLLSSVEAKANLSTGTTHYFSGFSRNGITLSSSYVTIPFENFTAEGSGVLRYTPQNNPSTGSPYLWANTGNSFTLKANINSSAVNADYTYTVYTGYIIQYSSPYTVYTTQDVIINYLDDTSETLVTGDTSVAIPGTKLASAKNIEIVYRFTQTCDRMRVQGISPRILAKYSGNFSRAIGISTEYGLRVGGGQYATPYYFNVNADDTLQSISTTPLYPLG